ncbi:MAG: aspartate--ammonia ligase [Sedimentisphaerales bacterium]|nr:aspartate--ammonia ligase [Sedimentisphaerales bacterium]
MSDLFIAENYQSKLPLRETERAIKFVKDYFQDYLAEVLNLQRVSAPLFVLKGSGVNDDLNGVERKVSFPVKAADETVAECLFSLAKWKRMALAEYEFQQGEGLYTDMNAIRPDEESLDNLHSIYVDQWDWERIISGQERNLDFLKEIVRKIYRVLKNTETVVHEKYPQLTPMLPNEITFVHTEELFDEYPNLTAKERENKALRKYGAVFLIGIGGTLPDGSIHDGRAPDYDDWTTPIGDGKNGLNGDILLWYPLLNRTFEISSMGIRVDKDALLRQLEIRNALDKKEQLWHKRLLNDEFPLCIGGGIGQSRLCMFFLQKLHIGEVHASVWPDDVLRGCKEAGVRLL